MKKQEKLVKIIFWLYAAALFILVGVKFTGSIDALAKQIRLFKSYRAGGGMNANLIPFRTILMQLRHLKSPWAGENLAANILVFVPYGFLLPAGFVKMHRGWKVLLAGFLFIFGIEVFQLVTLLGAFDVDDILLNMIGVAAGYYLFRLQDRKML